MDTTSSPLDHLFLTLNLHGLLCISASLAEKWDEVQRPHAVVDSVAYLGQWGHQILTHFDAEGHGGLGDVCDAYGQEALL